MDDPILTIEEREAINTGRWFSSLSPSLRHDILRCAYVKRYKDGELIVARGDPPVEWSACARGAVRVSSTSISGKQITLTYVEPGIWFGDVAIFDGDRRTHDAYAHGETTLLCVARTDFQKILALHVELYEALVRLQSRRARGADQPSTGTGRAGAIAGRFAPAGQSGAQGDGTGKRHPHRAGWPGRAGSRSLDAHR